MSLLSRAVVALEGIRSNTAPSPFAVEFQIFACEENNMKKGRIVSLSVRGKASASAPNPISDSAPQAIAVFGIDAAGVYGAPLAPGASIAMTMGPGANGVPGTFVQDAAAGVFDFTDPSGVAHKSVQSVASGVFTPSTGTAVDVNDPFPISYAITGGSGDSGSAQFQTQVGAEVAEVIGMPTAAATK
jgi:hypothetical protein